jgi:CheY-like chemotaxis protein
LPEPQWLVYRADTALSALTLLRKLRPVPVVVCERDLLPGSWQGLLEKTAFLPEPPAVVVASRLADDYLRAEALNLGAYDVLAKPFDVAELTRSLSLAWLHGQGRGGVSDTLPKVMTAGAA